MTRVDLTVQLFLCVVEGQ